MALPTAQLPRLQAPNSTEDAKIVAVIAELQSIISSVGSVNIAQNSITSTEIEAQSAYATVALGPAGGVWAGTTTLGYWKDSLGIVHIRADAYTPGAPGVTGPGAVIATLPAGFRPGVKLAFSMGLNFNPNNNQASTPMEINTDGTVVYFRSLNWPAGQTRQWVSGPEFLAEN